MSPGADLFVVCKQCGSEVSPYITECPYCGHRLRRRAPKLPRALDADRSSRGRRRWSLKGRSSSALPRGRSRLFRAGADAWASSRPRATIALVAVGAGAWIAFHARPILFGEMAIIGPLDGDWWKLFSSQFAYANGFDAFVTLVAITIFGWLLERRHGPV